LNLLIQSELAKGKKMGEEKGWETIENAESTLGIL